MFALKRISFRFFFCLLFGSHFWWYFMSDESWSRSVFENAAHSDEFSFQFRNSNVLIRFYQFGRMERKGNFSFLFLSLFFLWKSVQEMERHSERTFIWMEIRFPFVAQYFIWVLRFVFFIAIEIWSIFDNAMDAEVLHLCNFVEGDKGARQRDLFRKLRENFMQTTCLFRMHLTWATNKVFFYPCQHRITIFAPKICALCSFIMWMSCVVISHIFLFFPFFVCSPKSQVKVVFVRVKVFDNISFECTSYSIYFLSASVDPDPFPFAFVLALHFHFV